MSEQDKYSGINQLDNYRDRTFGRWWFHLKSFVLSTFQIPIFFLVRLFVRLFGTAKFACAAREVEGTQFLLISKEWYLTNTSAYRRIHCQIEKENGNKITKTQTFFEVPVLRHLFSRRHPPTRVQQLTSVAKRCVMAANFTEKATDEDTKTALDEALELFNDDENQ
jgi:hypothetical protein